MKYCPPTRVVALEQENRRLRAYMEQAHHHLRVYKLLEERNIPELAAWMLMGERLQQTAEELLPHLK